MNYLLATYIIIIITIVGYIFRVNLSLSKHLKEIQNLGISKRDDSIFDKSGTRIFLIFLSLTLLAVATYMALIWAPNAKGEPPTYRILFFHVPSAIMSYIGFFITFLGGILYLKKKDLKFDRWATVGADLGLHFSMLMLISGIIWGKQRWGAWWIWEPRLTSALILAITYIGYLILRRVIDNPSTKSRYASVYGIMAFATVPFVHYAIKFWGSVMHPVIEKTDKSSGLSAKMVITLNFSHIVFLVVFFTMYVIRLRAENLEADIHNHKIKVLEEDDD